MKKFLTLIACAAMALTSISCDDDSENTLSDGQKEKAAALLEGDIVVSARTSVNGVDKTLLESGAPCKFNFERLGGGKLIMRQPDFQIGAMPFPINFAIEVELGQILSLEESDFAGDGWVRFSGKRGVIDISGKTPESAVDESATGDGSTVTGYVNTETQEIQMQISYAMMTVECNIARQKIDPSRVGNFDQEVEQYIQDLEKYKQEHGM